MLGSITGIETLHWWNPSGVQNVVIGGTAAGNGNEIAGHLDSGISVANTFSGVRITGNSIHDNGGIGIDLVTPLFENGVTPNDPLDADSGGNGLQNFPVLTSASGTGANTTVQGSLNSLANQAFTLEFFVNPMCGPTGYGQGKAYLGAATVTTGSTGNATFSATLPGSVAADSVITATATQNSTGNTSEFSACITSVVVPNPAGDIDGNGLVNVTDADLFVAVLLGNNSNTQQVDRSDLNHDGLEDGRDVSPFVAALLGG